VWVVGEVEDAAGAPVLPGTLSPAVFSSDLFF
jgi:hypothetical protein